MRKRERKKQFWFNDEECEILAIKSTKAGLNESEFVREIIKDYEIKEKPDDRFYQSLKVIRSIANNMNQISKKAHSLGFIDEAAYKKNAERILKFIEEFKDKYLREKRGDEYND